MGLIRLIMIVLLVLVIWRMFKIYQAQQLRRDQGGKVLKQDKMVKCQYCAVHIPQQNALEDHGNWFCGRRHKELYLQGK